MKKIIFFLLGVSLYIGCKDDEITPSAIDCPYSSIENIRRVYAPDSVKIDSAILIRYTWDKLSCHSIDQYDVNIAGNSRTVQLKTSIDTCNCTDTLSSTVLLDYIFYSHTIGIEIIDYGTTKDTIVIY